jgi:hypothetical protein
MGKFEQIMNGEIKATPDEVQKALEEEVRGCSDLKTLNDFLTKLHPSSAYTTIRDIVQPKTNFMIKQASKEEDKSEYQRFQDIQQQAKAVFDYERKTATIFEVNQISTQIAQRFYGITVRMISMMDDELGKVEQAINKIEGHLGLDVTNFEKENEHDTTKPSNEQRSEEIIN